VKAGASMAGRRPADLDEVAQDLANLLGSVMTAMGLFSNPHRGQSNGLSLSASRPPSPRASAPAGPGLPPWGSILYTFAISLAQAERQAACGTVAGSVASACVDMGSARDCRHPWENAWPPGTPASLVPATDDRPGSGILTEIM
jgi:hypothetical protein